MNVTVTYTTPEQLRDTLNKQQKVVILDVRAEDKYNDFHIQDPQIESLNIPKTDIFALTDEEAAPLNRIPKDQKIIVTCTTGNSAAKCAAILEERGYDIAVLEGGITAWKKLHDHD